MAGDSISSLILFIAAIVVATGVAGTMTVAVGDVSSSLDSNTDQVSESIATDLFIISDAGSDAVYDSNTDTLTILVKNTGTTTLDADANTFDVLVDGAYVVPSDVSRVGGGVSWAPGDVVSIEVDTSLSSGEHRVMVVANQNRDSMVIFV